MSTTAHPPIERLGRGFPLVLAPPRAKFRIIEILAEPIRERGEPSPHRTRGKRRCPSTTREHAGRRPGRARGSRDPDLGPVHVFARRPLPQGLYAPAHDASACRKGKERDKNRPPIRILQRRGPVPRVRVETKIPRLVHAEARATLHIPVQNRIRAHPQPQPRVVVPRAVLEQPRGDVHLLPVEQVPAVVLVPAVALVLPQLARREVLRVLWGCSPVAHRILTTRRPRSAPGAGVAE